jgi:hypothetical protein
VLKADAKAFQISICESLRPSLDRCPLVEMLLPQATDVTQAR